jgi:hypothetical protein
MFPSNPIITQKKKVEKEKERKKIINIGLSPITDTRLVTY